MRGDLLAFSSFQQWESLWVLGSRAAAPSAFLISFCSRSPASGFWTTWRVAAGMWLLWSCAPRESPLSASLSFSSVHLSHPYALHRTVFTYKGCESISPLLHRLTTLLKWHSLIINSQSLVKALLYPKSNSFIGDCVIQTEIVCIEALNRRKKCFIGWLPRWRFFWQEIINVNTDGNNYISSMSAVLESYQNQSFPISHSYFLKRSIRIKSSRLPPDFFGPSNNFRYDTPSSSIQVKN